MSSGTFKTVWKENAEFKKNATISLCSTGVAALATICSVFTCAILMPKYAGLLEPTAYENKMSIVTFFLTILSLSIIGVGFSIAAIYGKEAYKKLKETKDQSKSGRKEEESHRNSTQTYVSNCSAEKGEQDNYCYYQGT